VDGSEILISLCSHDLAPSNFCLFPEMSIPLQGTHVNQLTGTALGTANYQWVQCDKNGVFFKVFPHLDKQMANLHSEKRLYCKVNKGCVFCFHYCGVYVKTELILECTFYETVDIIQFSLL